MKVVDWLLDRLDEPSSWAAIAAGLAGAGINIDSGLWQGIVWTGMGIATIVGFVLKEKKA